MLLRMYMDPDKFYEDPDKVAEVREYILKKRAELLKKRAEQEKRLAPERKFFADLRVDVDARSFPRFHQQVRHLIESGLAIDSEKANVLSLTRTPTVLAAVAEATPEFKDLASHMIHLGSPDEWEDPNIYEGYAREVQARLSDLLRRSGYYEAAIAGEDSRAYFERVANRIMYPSIGEPFKVKILRLLAGAAFCRREFELCGFKVALLVSDKDLESLGPHPKACDDFFPGEKLAHQGWFLLNEVEGFRRDVGDEVPIPELEEPATSAQNLDSSSAATSIASKYNIIESIKSEAMESRSFVLSALERQLVTAGVEVVSFIPTDIPTPGAPMRKSMRKTRRYGGGHADHLAPILTLLLFNDELFDMPLGLVSEPGWKLHRMAMPGFEDENKEITYASETYTIREEHWSKFEKFAKVCGDVLPSNARVGNSIVPTDYWHRFAIALRRYLTASFSGARFIPGFSIRLQSQEDILDEAPEFYLLDVEPTIDAILLYYVFILEALFVKPGEQNKNKERVRNGCATLLNRDNKEWKSIRKFLNGAYEDRNNLVHGNEPKRKVSLVDLRRACQRVLAACVFLLAETKNATEAQAALDEATEVRAPIKYADALARARDAMYASIKNPAPIIFDFDWTQD